MHTSEAGIDLIKKWEGCHDVLTNPGKITAYLCPASIPTIGFGSTRMLDGRPVRYSDSVKDREVITMTEAEQLLAHEISEVCEPTIERLCRVPLAQCQYDALSSFIFNVGAGAFADSTLLRLLNLGDYQGAADQLLRWITGGGRILEGLVRRRREERAMFISGILPAEDQAFLVVGEKGESVVKLQTSLNSHGEDIRVDGIFGSKTEEAVKRFQAKSGLVPDGIVGPKTWDKLQLSS
jgi:lysozyme